MSKWLQRNTEHVVLVQLQFRNLSQCGLCRSNAGQSDPHELWFMGYKSKQVRRLKYLSPLTLILTYHIVISSVMDWFIQLFIFFVLVPTILDWFHIVLVPAIFTLLLHKISIIVYNIFCFLANIFISHYLFYNYYTIHDIYYYVSLKIRYFYSFKFISKYFTILGHMIYGIYNIKI